MSQLVESIAFYESKYIDYLSIFPVLPMSSLAFEDHDFLSISLKVVAHMEKIVRKKTFSVGRQRKKKIRLWYRTLPEHSHSFRFVLAPCKKSFFFSLFF